MGYRDRDQFPLRHIQKEPSGLSRNGICKLCENEVSLESNAFYCRTCWSHYHKDCLTITYPKIHEHTLTFIHRNNAFTCDACGLVDEEAVNMFACLQCDFFVHRKCIFLPKIIKITRHPHYLSHTLCITNGNLRCRICRNNHGKLKIGYGGYICIEESCDYVAHSFCATLKKVWDGRDVEGEHEEESNSEADVAALVEIGGKYIPHFSHDHDLMRFDVEREEEGGHVCQACILPIEFGCFLGCKQCDFALHDACASLPRKMESTLHRHPLTLRIDMMNMEEGFFTCSTCQRESCGFMYQCSQEDCGFKIDVKCASFLEPLNHLAHPGHPFYLKQYTEDAAYLCEGCDQRSTTVVHCDICYFPLEFKCVTLPRLVKYKYDAHPLTLYRAKTYTMSWRLCCLCDICEETIYLQKLFYFCHGCMTILHIGCMLGKYPYLKPNHRIKVDGLNLEIASNNNVSRPICHACHRICQDKLVFTSGKDICFCSIDCIHSSKDKLV